MGVIIIKPKITTHHMANRKTADALFKYLFNMGYHPENIVHTGFGVFFTITCEQIEKDDLSKFISDF